jgi:hypothetical protein
VCVLGFRENVELMSALCDSQRPVTRPPERAHCASWADETALAVQECVAKSQPSVNLWSVFDDEGDGDFDLVDLAGFQDVYQVTPKLVQSEAVLVAVECCVPESVIRNLGACLSGPQETNLPAECEASTDCVYGFSELIEIGDWQYTMCTSKPPVLPDPFAAYCISWDGGVSVTFICHAAHLPGHSLAILADDDGDEDVDLADFATFQREFGVD